MSVFVVERGLWRPTNTGLARLPGWETVAIHSDQSIADEAVLALEWQARRQTNPFRYGPAYLHYQSSFPPDRLHDWFLDLGLDSPPESSNSNHWADWWMFHEPRMSPRQRGLAWEAIDRVRFFRTRETTRSTEAQVMAHCVFAEDPISDTQYSGWQRFAGCSPYMLSFQVATANAICHDLYLMELGQSGGWFTRSSLPTDWLRHDERLPGEVHSDQPTDDVHRVACPFFGPDPRPGQDVFVVLRTSWRLYEASNWWRWMRSDQGTCGVPVAAFAQLDAADAFQAQMELDVRGHQASPFRFGPALEWGTMHAASIWGTLSTLAPIVFTNMWTDYQGTDQLWSDWWDSVAPGLSPSQVQLAWSLFDRLKFYEVTAVEYRP